MTTEARMNEPSPTQHDRDLRAEREARWLMEDVALAARERLRALSYASYFVPVKQHDRSQAEQEAVEVFTTALVEARQWLREHGMPVPEARDHGGPHE